MPEPAASALQEEDAGDGTRALSGRGSFRFPRPAWVRAYRREWLGPDLVAGLTLAAYAVPVSMAYASLAGLPPQCGIYCYLVGGVAYALFGSSRQLAVGPTSAISMLVGATVAGLAGGDARRAAAIAALTALVVAVLNGLSWVFRLSGLMSFVSETVLVGFKAGAALTIALTQLPKLFGVPGGGEHFFERLTVLARQLPETNVAVLAFGLVALALLLAGEKLLPGRPVALFVVTLAVVIATFTSAQAFGIGVVGELPQGLPDFRPPSLRLRDVDGVLPLACACFLLSYIESVSAGRALASAHRYEIEPRRELLGLGAANLAAAFSQGFPVAGGLSQSAVNDKAGARSPLALVVASAALGLCVSFLTELLKNLPSVILAAVVLVAVRGLIDVPALVRLRRISRAELGVALIAFAGVLLFGILHGVMVAAVASLLMVVAAAARPPVAFLGRIPGTGRFSDLARHPENEQVPGVLIFRAEAAILYFNADHVRRVVRDKVRDTPGLRFVVCELSNSPRVDAGGARMLAALHQELADVGIQLRLAEARSRVRDLLRSDGLEARVGYFGRRLPLAAVIEEIERTGGATIPPQEGAPRRSVTDPNENTPESDPGVAR